MAIWSTMPLTSEIPQMDLNQGSRRGTSWKFACPDVLSDGTPILEASLERIANETDESQWVFELSTRDATYRYLPPAQGILRKAAGAAGEERVAVVDVAAAIVPAAREPLLQFLDEQVAMLRHLASHDREQRLAGNSTDFVDATDSIDILEREVSTAREALPTMGTSLGDDSGALGTPH